jgi:hypothetical protein
MKEDPKLTPPPEWPAPEGMQQAHCPECDKNLGEMGTPHRAGCGWAATQARLSTNATTTDWTMRNVPTVKTPVKMESSGWWIWLILLAAALAIAWLVGVFAVPVHIDPRTQP